MRLMGIGLLHEFSSKHVDAKKWIDNWIADVRGSKWTTTHDIKKKYPTASYLAANVVIFNVKGNKYRLETQVAYQVGIVSINWIGTHAEYDKRNYK